jgi:hypothetical protein
VHFVQTNVSSDDFHILARAPSLEELTLTGPSFDDKVLEHLKHAPVLQQLAIHGGTITDEGLKHLIDYPALETFTVSRSPLPAQQATITDRGLEYLGLTCINRLYIGGAAITDAGLKHLAQTKSLRSLSVNGTQVTREGLDTLLSHAAERRATMVTAELVRDGRTAHA